MAKRKRKGGLLALVVGMAVGAAASFLSKEENRNKVKKTAKRAVSKAKSAEKKAVRSAKRVVKKGKAAAKKTTRRVAKKK